MKIWWQHNERKKMKSKITKTGKETQNYNKNHKPELTRSQWQWPQINAKWLLGDDEEDRIVLQRPPKGDSFIETSIKSCCHAEPQFLWFYLSLPVHSALSVQQHRQMQQKSLLRAFLRHRKPWELNTSVIPVVEDFQNKTHTRRLSCRRWAVQRQFK